MTEQTGGIVQCICHRIKVGMTVTDTRNWNPDCPEHGVDSAWWMAPEQVEKRDADNKRLRDLQMQARAARQQSGRDADLPTVADLVGSDPEFTGGLSAVEYQRNLRGDDPQAGRP